MARRAANQATPRHAAQAAEDDARTPEEAMLDEACFLAELRRHIEGARTPDEESRAARDPDWQDRFGRICRRYAG